MLATADVSCLGSGGGLSAADLSFFFVARRALTISFLSAAKMMIKLLSIPTVTVFVPSDGTDSGTADTA